MLDPSRLRIELPNLGVGAPANPPARVDDENGSAGGTLIDRKNHLRHRENFSRANVTRDGLNAKPCAGFALPRQG